MFWRSLMEMIMEFARLGAEIRLLDFSTRIMANKILNYSNLIRRLFLLENLFIMALLKNSVELASSRSFQLQGYVNFTQRKFQEFVLSYCQFMKTSQFQKLIIQIERSTLWNVTNRNNKKLKSFKTLSTVVIVIWSFCVSESDFQESFIKSFIRSRNCFYLHHQILLLE